MFGPRSTLVGAVVGLSLTAASPVPAPGAYDVAGTYARVAAEAPCRVEARDLAGIQSVESPSAVVDATGLVSNPDGSPVRGDGGDSFGPFQFNQPAGTWARYGNGGDPDRLPDAAAATARKLCASGYETDRRSAIRAHNGSGPAAEAYADRVLGIADELGAATFTPTPATSPQASQGDRFDGITLHITDHLIGAAVEQWEALEGRLGNKPTTLSLYKKVDGAVDQLAGDSPVAAPSAPSRPSAAPVNGLVCPVVDGLVVGDGWGAARTGHTHQGIDLFGTAGGPVVAPFDGRVSEVVDDEAAGGLGGLAVTLRATSGPQTGAEVYLAHNDRNLVTAGQQVRQGQQIAVVGNSGNARGGDTHVHVQWYPPGLGTPAPAESTIGRACGQGGITDDHVLP